jgi:8-oxo-dGTP diphosphatase
MVGLQMSFQAQPRNNPQSRCRIEKIVVGAVITDKDGRVLFLKRKMEPFLGGKYELPAGIVKKGEDLFDALKRELKEETGLEASAVKQCAGSHDFVSRTGKRMRRFDFAVLAEGIVRIDQQEHDSYTWSAPGEIEITENSKKALAAYNSTINKTSESS